MITLPTPSPQEFCDDVVRVALRRESDFTLAQIVNDFGMYVGTLDQWLRQAHTETGDQPGTTTTERDKLNELRKMQLHICSTGVHSWCR